MTKITAIAAIAAAVVLGCNPPTNPPPTPVQPKTPLKLVYGTDNTIQAVRNKALDSPRPTLTPKGTTAKYSISDAPPWLTVNADTGVLSAAADKTGTLTKGAKFTATVTAAGVGGAYDKETAEAKISINVVDELIITFNPPSGTTLPSAGEPHVTGTKNAPIEFGGTFTVNPPDPSVAYELDRTSDPLPPGLTIDPKTGKITGTPTAPTKGPINIIIRAKDTTAKVTLRLQINPDAFPAGMSYAATTIARGSSTSVALTGAEDVTAEYAFDTSGSNPAAPSWLTIKNTGAISVGNGTNKVPDGEPFGTTTYKITVTGTGQYAAIPPQTLDFSLTVEAATFPDPLNLSMGSMILNSDNRSGTASVTDSNNPKLTVTYAYAPNPPNTATPTRPGWLGINSETGEITVTNAPPSAFPAIGATKTYKIRITGTGKYEGREKDIDFITSGAAINLPAGMAYAPRTTVEKGSSRSGTGAVSVLNAPGVDAKYAFEPSPPAPPWLTIDENSGAVSIGPTLADPTATVPADAHGPTGGEVDYKIKVTGQGIYKDKTKTLNFTLKVDPASIGTFTYSGRAAGTPTSAGVLPITLTAKTTALTTAASTDDVFLDVSNLNPDIADVTFSINDATDFNARTNLTFNTSGTNKGKITGTPSKVFTAGATYTITATGDSGIYQGATATKRIRITVNPAPFGTIDYSDTSALVANIGAAITARTITAPTDAGHTNVTYSIAPNLNTNTGLNFNTANGTIDRTPTKASNNTTYTITARGNDNTIYQGYTRSTTIAIRVPEVIPNVAYSSLSVAKGSSGTTEAVSGAPADGGLTYAFAAAQPAWLGIDSTTGTITVGTNSTTNKVPANANSSYSIAVNVNGAGGSIYAGATQKTVTFALTVTPAVIPDVSYGSATMTKGTAGQRDISAGAPSTGLTYAFAETQPAWLAINSTTGRISIGTTTSPVPGNAASSYAIRVNVNGAAGSIYAGAAQKTVTFNLTVTAATLPAMSYGGTETVARGSAVTASLTNGIDANYTQQTPVAVTGGAVASRAPALTFNTTNGAITGPTTIAASTPAGTYTYTIRVTGKPGSIYTGTGASSQDVTFTLRVTPAPIPTNMSYAAASVQRGSAVTASLTNGINANYVQQSVTVPTGATTSNAPALTFNTTNGAITGPTTIATSTPVGTYTYTIRVTGKAGTIYAGAAYEDVEFALTVTQPLPSSMSYRNRSGSRYATSNISEPLYSGTSSTTALPAAIAADQADFSVLNTPANAPALTVNNVGRVSLTVDASSTSGTYRYTIRVTGKGIYAGSTRDVTFQLSVTG